MTSVSLLKCSNYELDQLIPIITQSLSLILDPKAIFTEGKKVFLKVNSVSHSKAELGFVTHPKFLQALIRVLKQYPAEIMVGDNPPVKDMTAVFRANGLLDVINEEKVALCKPNVTTTITNPTPLLYPHFEVTKEMVEADILINLPKLKTHSFTYFSGAEKNLFGLIPGLNKAAWHARANNPLHFGTMINDLYLATKSNFTDQSLIHLMDAIDILEGDGPTTGGTKRHLGVILASTSAIALDRVAMEVAGLDPSKAFIMQIAKEKQIEASELSEIEIKGLKLGDWQKPEIKEPGKSISKLKLLEKQFIKNLLLEHPKINNAVCLRCGECTRICPAQTMKIKVKGAYPTLNTKTCIRCWCCSEVCPVNAISQSKRPILGRVIMSFYQNKK